MIDLSITTSQRMDLFVQSVTSIKERVQGFTPKTIYHYDDSSCEEERAEMQYMLRYFFKPKRMVSRFYDANDFKDGYRHSRIMQDWKYDMAHSNSRYVLHTEDDWQFIEDININEALSNFKNKKTAMLGFTEPFRNFPENIFEQIEYTDKTWKWYYDENKLLLEPLFVDNVEYPDVNSYINSILYELKLIIISLKNYDLHSVECYKINLISDIESFNNQSSLEQIEKILNYIKEI